MVDASTRKHCSVSACRRVGGRNRCACLDECKILLFYIKYALGIILCIYVERQAGRPILRKIGILIDSAAERHYLVETRPTDFVIFFSHEQISFALARRPTAHRLIIILYIYADSGCA